MLNTIHSELLKIIYTRSTIVTMTIYSMIALISPIIMEVFFTNVLDMQVVGAQWVLSFMKMFIPTMMMVIVIASTTTSEYAHRTQSVTLLSTPQRTKVAVAKWIATSLFMVIWSGATSLLGNLVYLIMRIGDTNIGLNATSIIYSPGLYLLTIPILVAFTHGVAYLIRSIAGVIAIMMIMLMRIDQMIIFVPKIDNAVDYLFIRNLRSAWDVSNTTGDLLTYFGISIIWAAVVFIAGIIVLNKRDA